MWRFTMARLHGFVFFCIVVLVATTAMAGALEQGFADPPRAARPGAFWPWLNGNVDLNRVTYELEQMKAKGMAGADIWDVRAAINPNNMIPAGPAFLSDDSLKAIRHAVDQANRLGLRLGMIAASGWNAGGPWVKPADAGKGLFCSRATLQGPAHTTIRLPFPEVPEHCPKNSSGHPTWWHDVAVLAFPENQQRVIPNRDAVVDLSGQLDKQGRLTWAVPQGKWTVLRFVTTNTGYQLIVPSPNSEGPMIDFLDPGATRMHFQHIIDRLHTTLGDLSQTSLKYLEVDSMELGDDTPWTQQFVARFTEQTGYNPVPFLPALQGWTVGDREITSRFLYDWRRFLSDLFIDSHYRTGRRVLNQNGLKLCAEAGGPGAPIWPSCPVEALKALGSVDIMRGEFWPKHRNMRLVKEIASAAHIYGKRVVDAESFTSWRHWQDGPYFHKQLADNAFGEGLNHLTFHTFTHSPTTAGLPGWEYHAGTHINPNCVWWPLSRPFIDYLARCSYLLQQGRFVADVCYYYGAEAPNFVPPKHLKFNPGSGYDYDVVNRDVILHRMRVESGRIVLPDGMNYAVLVLPERDVIDLDVLVKLEALIRAGATVIGPKPARTQTLVDYPDCDRRVQTLAAKIWGPDGQRHIGPRRYGKGRVVVGRAGSDVLHEAGISPDFMYQGSDPRTRLDFIHRRHDNMDVYFVSNRNERWEDVDCSFRTHGRQPELWHPDTGHVEDTLVYREESQRTIVPLHMAPAESLFVVFRRPSTRGHFVTLHPPVAGSVPHQPALLPHSATPGGPMWLSDGTADVASQWITFDLGRKCDLTKIRLWNYNENVLGHVNYGVKAMRIQVSADHDHYRTCHACTLDAAPENEDRLYSQDVPVSAKGVRYVRLAIESNHNMPNYSDGISNRVGLSKIAFYGPQPIDRVTVESVSSGRAFDPASDTDLGQIHPDAQVTSSVTGAVCLRAWRPGSYTLVDSDGHRQQINVADVPRPINLTGPWQVDFTSGRGAPPTTSFEQLQSWTESDTAAIKYYSGIARYHKQFRVPGNVLASDVQVVLDLGVVQKVARVTLNGQVLGVLWKSPFRLVITGQLRPGVNDLCVEVANTWTNRLIGDAYLPEGEQYCKTNLHDRLARRGRSLQVSGLIGPVRLEMARNVAIRDSTSP